MNALLIFMAIALTAWGLWKFRGEMPDISQSDSLLKFPITSLAKAIQQFEGYYAGTRAFKNNNPGNLRYTEWTKTQGATGKDDKGFSIFPSYAVGFAALIALLRLRVKQHPTWSILDLINNYAPASDGNDPDHYGETIAQIISKEGYPVTKDTGIMVFA